MSSVLHQRHQPGWPLNTCDCIDDMSTKSVQTTSSRVKACTECRQQKLRCDAFKDQSRPCLRCARMNLHCVVLRTFKRVKKRTKADLQAELDRLNRQLAATKATESDSAVPASPIPLSPDGDMSPNAYQLPPPAGRLQQTPSQLSYSMTNPDTALSAATTASPNVGHGVGSSGLTPTSSQTLEDLELGGAQIDDCFCLFLTHYAPKVHIFDTALDPDVCHAQSPLLFWTITAIGARNYSKDPTILSLLAPKVLELAQRAIFQRENPLPTLQSFLLLVIWPMPIDTLHKDFSPVLAGAMLNLAVTVGLHVHGMGQDYSRITLHHGESDRIFRTKLWLSCLIASQSTTISNGLPPPMVLDTYDYLPKEQNAFAGVPIELRFRRKLSQQLASSILELGRVVISVNEPGGATSLRSMIDIFLWQLSQLKSECPDQLNGFFLLCGQLQVQSFHFFIPPPLLEATNLMRLYILACTVIETIMLLTDAEDASGTATAYIQKMLMLAAFVILRIARSHISSTVDLERGRKAYFALILYCRKTSVQDSDLPSRSAVILTQLWTSKLAFMHLDGTVDSLTLQCRSRLSMSVVFDCFWRWRREFASQPMPYQETRHIAGGDGAGINISPIVPAANLDNSKYILSSWSPQGTFPDYDWAASLGVPIESWDGFQQDFDIPAVSGP